MKKLLFKIKDNTLSIKERVKLNNDYNSIINTNIISCNELVFSDSYINDNANIVGTFLNELCNNYGINTIIIYKNEFAPLIIKTLKNNKAIINIIFKEDEQLTFKLCELIAKTNIKNISCYNLQPFMIEYLDKHNILVESRNEILFLSKFMLNNNLNIFSSLFYKMSLRIEFPLSNQDEEDFIAFCKINKYLKTIDVTKVNKNDLEFIIKILRENNKKNIKICIHDNIEDEETINYLKDFNKKKAKRYKIHYKLIYSKEFLKENLVKQTNYSILKFCGYLIIFIIFSTFFFIFYDNYVSLQSDEEIKDYISKIIDIDDGKEIVDQLNKDKLDNEKKVVNNDLASLYNVNPDTVAWLKVPDTNIDYPVVQSNNNDYYLNHNFNFEKDRKGWVFMDYRNNMDEISENTIIYAHNRYHAGIMFGTLYKTQRSSWYKNPENHIISLKTLYENLEYQVFSVYKIATTTDYLKTLFANKKEKKEFLQMLTERSLYNFKVELNDNAKILTLSTCADENNRYVLHAVLIENKKEFESN